MGYGLGLDCSDEDCLDVTSPVRLPTLNTARRSHAEFGTRSQYDWRSGACATCNLKGHPEMPAIPTSEITHWKATIAFWAQYKKIPSHSNLYVRSGRLRISPSVVLPPYVQQPFQVDDPSYFLHSGTESLGESNLTLLTAAAEQSKSEMFINWKKKKIYFYTPMNRALVEQHVFQDRTPKKTVWGNVPLSGHLLTCALTRDHVCPCEM